MNPFHRTQRNHQPSVSASRARRPRRQRLGIEALEGRQLLSLGPPDFVNTNPRDHEGDSANATNSNGQSVVAWVDRSSTNIGDVYAQMFNADGTKRGLQIQVAFSNLNHTTPAVAIDAKGDFVVAYAEGPASSQTIAAKRYNSLGQQIGGQVAHLSLGVGDLEFDPSVAMDNAGDFTITYTEADPKEQVIARQFNSSGTFLDDLFVDGFVNNNNDTQARVASDHNGYLAIVYTSKNLTTGNQTINLAEFSPGGTSVGIVTAITGASPAITNGFDRVSAPSVSINDGDSVVIAYEFNDGGANGGNSSIGAQRFSYGGETPIGSPILIQANTATVDFFTSVALLTNDSTYGPFVVGYGNQRLNKGAEVTVVNSLDNGDTIEEQDQIFFALARDKVAVSANTVTSNFLVSYTASDFFNNPNNFNILRVIGQPNSGPAAQNLALTPTIQAGQLAHLTGSLTDAAGDTNLTLTVNWGDGTKPQQTKPGLKPFDVAHRYLKPGTYKVHATWSDEQGRSNGRDLLITVK